MHSPRFRNYCDCALQLLDIDMHTSGYGLWYLNHYQTFLSMKINHSALTWILHHIPERRVRHAQACSKKIGKHPCKSIQPLWVHMQHSPGFRSTPTIVTAAGAHATHLGPRAPQPGSLKEWHSRGGFGLRSALLRVLHMFT